MCPKSCYQKKRRRLISNVLTLRQTTNMFDNNTDTQNQSERVFANIYNANAKTISCYHEEPVYRTN